MPVSVTPYRTPESRFLNGVSRSTGISAEAQITPEAGPPEGEKKTGDPSGGYGSELPGSQMRRSERGRAGEDLRRATIDPSGGAEAESRRPQTGGGDGDRSA